MSTIIDVFDFLIHTLTSSCEEIKINRLLFDDKQKTLHFQRNLVLQFIDQCFVIIIQFRNQSLKLSLEAIKVSIILSKLSKLSLSRVSSIRIIINRIQAVKNIFRSQKRMFEFFSKSRDDVSRRFVVYSDFHVDFPQSFRVVIICINFQFTSHFEKSIVDCESLIICEN